MKAVVADDDLVVRHILTAILSERYEVVECVSGLECISYFETHSADILFLDIQLPDLSGPDVLVRLREMENGKTVKVISVSANCEEEMRSMFTKTQPDAFLEKPFTPEQVETVL